MADVVDWGLAEKVAVRAAGRHPLESSYHWDRLGDDFARFTARAEDLVAAETGLRSLDGPARARVTDRAGWVRANIAGFQRLLGPITDKLGVRVQGPMGAVMRRAAALEVGLLLGWMSGRVLGQYDLLVAADENPEEQDIVYYVGPNVLALEKRFAFPPEEFRLWLALHEVTHRAQFTGVPWMREHYLSLIDNGLGSVEVHPGRLLDAAQRAFQDLRSGKSPLADGGIAHALAGPDQRAALQRIAGLMSLLEGHGDITMDRAAVDSLPSAPRFGRVLRQRRAQAGVIQKFVQQLLGLEAKLNQYAEGERFITEVERLGGPDALEAVWRGPSWLPTLDEIRDPNEWLERVRLSDELVG